MKFKRTNLDIFASLFFLILSALIYYFMIEKTNLSAIGNPKKGLTAGFFPQLIIFLFIIANLVLLCSSLLKKYKFKENNDFLIIEDFNIKQLLSVVFLLFIYIISIDIFGFYVSSFLFLFITVYFIFKVKNWIIFLSLSLGVLFMIFIFFQKMLNVWFPKGLIF